jgi:glycosyltransferase involved in cell wall biosynthesis
MAVVEAMAHGVPVVVTKTCPWPDVAAAGAGRWVEQTAGAVAGAVDEILGDRALAESMSAAGRRLVADRYTWRAVGKAMAQHYRAAAALLDPIGPRHAELSRH